MTTEELIHKLPPYVRVTGSYARNKQTEHSDIDFYVPERHWDNFRKWSEENMEGMPSSPTMGALTWHEPMMVEFSDLFVKQSGIEKTVILFGRTFKTW